MDSLNTKRQSITIFGLGERVENALRSENIFRIGDLTERTEKEVLAATNSPAAVALIKAKLEEYGLSLKD